MMNRDTKRAWEYHDSTKHSYWSVRTTPHFLDWHNMPLPFKVYPEVAAIPLPRELPRTKIPALRAVAEDSDLRRGGKLDRDTLASMLYYSSGITKEKTYPGGTIYFRSAACAGALYPIETYVVCDDIDGLGAGVYHFGPGDFALRRLREGDYRRALVYAAAGEQRISSAPVVLVYTAISWRSSWKYRDRSYRYHFWDNGMVLANALAISRGHQLPAEVVMGFVEAEVNRLVGIDGRRELALALLPVGEGSGWPRAILSGDVPELHLATVPLSDTEVDYPSIYQMHEASSLTSPAEVEEWRRGVRVSSERVLGTREGITLAPIPQAEQRGAGLEEIILRRGSTRRFARRSLPFSELSVILDVAMRGVEADFVGWHGEQLNSVYLIINRVGGVEPGAYYYNRDARALELLARGDFSDKASHLALDQELGGDASATLFFMADLEAILARYGNRGYRAVQMEAGIIGGKVYLAAYALGRGATGLTFYDDDTTSFFSPHAEGKSCIFVTSVGIPGKRPLY